MNSYFFAIAIQLFGVTVASVSQLLLKNSAISTHKKWWHQFVNVRVIASYGAMLFSILCSSISLKVLPLSMTPVFTAYGQVLVYILSIIILKERVTRRSVLGLSLIIIGILLFM